MSDSLENLGGVAIWDLAHNWKSKISYNYDKAIKLESFPGTVHELFISSEETPQRLGITMLMENRQQKYEFLGEFTQIRGRHRAYWFPVPGNMFTLDCLHLSGAVMLTCKLNYFSFRGFERIYIKLKNGDMLTRSVSDAVGKSSENKTLLYLHTAIDRDLNQDDIAFFSLLIYARLDIDAARFRHATTETSTITARLLELVKEYPAAP